VDDIIDALLKWITHLLQTLGGKLVGTAVCRV
jgi:hypothetical protein